MPVTHAKTGERMGILRKLRSTCLKLLRRQHGVTILEYALLGALLSIAAIVAISATGAQISVLFTTVTNALSNANDAFAGSKTTSGSTTSGTTTSGTTTSGTTTGS